MDWIKVYDHIGTLHSDTQLNLNPRYDATSTGKLDLYKHRSLYKAVLLGSSKHLESTRYLWIPALESKIQHTVGQSTE